MDQNDQILKSGRPEHARVGMITHLSHRISGDKTSAMPVGQVGPEPVQHHGGAIAPTGEQQHMGEAPKYDASAARVAFSASSETSGLSEWD